MVVDFCVKNDRGGSSLIESYNRRRKRAFQSKPVQGTILKKNATTNRFRFSDYCRRRKSARKSKVVASPPRESGVNLRLVLRKQNPQESKNRAVLRDLELESRVFAFGSASGASGYSEGKQAIEESLARICNSADALLDCGSLDNYDRLDGISRGTYGAVYQARDRRTGEIVAMKDQLDGMIVPTLREIDILKSLSTHRHPGVVGFKEVVADDSDGVYIIMEYAEHDLHRYMEERMMSAGEVRAMMHQLLEGVKFLHENRVMHRDIKPSNILVDGLGVLKICDFGLSRRIDAAAGLYTTRVGTTWYRAPELLKGEKAYTEAVDMWAVGCVMAEMLLCCRGGCEAGGIQTICEIVVDAGGGDEGYERLRSEFFPAEMLTGAGFNLLKSLLCCDPSKRITAEDAVNHIWFEEEWC